MDEVDKCAVKSELADEIQRIRTFYGWPSSAPVTPYGLAKFGFYYEGKGDDAVRCFFCNLILQCWRPGDDVYQRHKKNNPDCSMFAEESAPSKPTRNTASNKQQSRNDYADANLENRFQRLKVTEELAVDPCYAKHPHYQTSAARIATFDNYHWPKSSSQKPKELAEAGFYYTGQGDKVFCYMCGGNLERWEPNDKPWTEHQQWFPTCELVKAYRNKTKNQQSHQNFGQEKTDSGQSYDFTDAYRGNDDYRNQQNEHVYRQIQLPSKRSSEVAVEFAGDETHYSIDGVSQVVSQLQPSLQHPVDQMNTASEMKNSQYTSLPPRLQASHAGDISQAVQLLVEDHFNKLDQHQQNNVTANSNNKILEDNDSETKSDQIKNSLTNNTPQQGLDTVDDKLHTEKKKGSCRLCHEADAIMLFMPCTHVSVCEGCAPVLQLCLTCKSPIEQSIKIRRV